MSITESPPTAADTQVHRPPHPAHVLPNHVDRPSISVIIPTLNEEKNLPYVLPKIPSWIDEIILVDGHSTDNTVEVARQLCPHIRIIMQTGKGKGDALRTGFAAAKSDIIVMIDADGSTSPEEIPAYIGALLAGADYVKGSRYLQGGGSADLTVLRSVGNLGITMLVRVLFGGTFSDLCYGYNAFWSSVVDKLDLDADGFEIETLMNLRALRAGLRVFEVPSNEGLRVHGESHLNPLRDGIRVLKVVFRELTDRQRTQALSAPKGLFPENLNGVVHEVSNERLM